MAVYAVGDVQGCLNPLKRLLERVGFDPASDRVWFTGDLVNRGPDSLGTLRFVKDLGASALTVLGNHDLHLLALAAGVDKKKQRDSLDDILSAPDRESLLTWLGAQPLLHHDSTLGYTLIHAGLLPSWDIPTAQRLAHEVETALRNDPLTVFRHMYGNQPTRWSEELRGMERLRVIINALTRLRFCDAEGNMDLQEKEAPGAQPFGLLPWFRVARRRSQHQKIVFGHWSTLGRHQGDNVISLDSGCVWGRALTAVRLDSDPPEFHDVPCT
jgi:bis(5'-nucleosyl)-tetraphosphatase (symmetrical)